MIQIQILAGYSDKPSISLEGFSHSVFTAFVCLYLLKSVPKPLKDASLWPQMGRGQSIHSGELDCSFSCPLLGGSSHSFSVARGLPVSPVVTVFGTRKVWHGVICIVQIFLYNFICPQSHLFCIWAQQHFSVSCTGLGTRFSFCLPPPLPLCIVIEFLQLNTESR